MEECEDDNENRFDGFGRIGRLRLMLYTTRIIRKEIDVVAVVDISTDASYFAYQLKYDSIHGNEGELSTKR